MDQQMAFLIAAIVCACTGIVLLVFAGLVWQMRRRCTWKTKARVTAIDTWGSNYAPIFTYDVDGESVSRKHLISVKKAWQRFQVGDDVILYYDPLNPQTYMLENASPWRPMAFFFLGGGLFAFFMAAVALFMKF